MKVVYIAHPIGGNVKFNIEKVIKIVGELNRTEPDIIPFAPYLVDCMALDDNKPEERARGFKNNFHYFTSGFVKELRLYGRKISKGMAQEVEWAQLMNIPIINCISTDEPFTVDENRVLKVVSEVTNVPIQRIKSDNRLKSISLARHLFVGTCFQWNVNVTLKKMGEMINRDHSTILNSKRVYNELLFTDKQFEKLTQTINRLL
ncbi:helix-turn-helix domain-containing protein [Pedobacter sp. Leaf170]|uniref:DUF7768 domain-containing protein n=1 Tax=Pedobacter sp. Leaf170 TaxID=2876558 RepID=UPI001E4A5D86|nr:helix-turn-helix domain-containing protein [Pedobacter sp. Leaf170]